MESTEQKSTQYHALIEKLDGVIAECLEQEARRSKQLEKVHPRYRYSAKNLIHYRAMRSKDLSRLQKQLKNLGFSRLAKAESHVLPSLTTTRGLLQLVDYEPNPEPLVTPEISIKESKRRLRNNVKALLGKRAKNKNAMIMVTMPSEAAHNFELVDAMVTEGMGIARINCAHDDPSTWLKIIGNIRKASESHSSACTIAMDLAGPKIRTGAFAPGPEIRKIRPSKDAKGRIIERALVWLGKEPSTEAPYFLPVDSIESIEKGSSLYFRDTRIKNRKIRILEVTRDGCLGSIPKTSYFQTGMILYREKQLVQPICKVGQLPAREGSVYLRPGDTIRLTKRHVIAPHFGPNHDKTGFEPIEIQCTNPAVIDQIAKGEPVKFDDGKFEGRITGVNESGAEIQITTVVGNGARLKAEKGINFPNSKLTVRGLTDKDKEDLKFVVEHADVVNMSFVNSVYDVQDLLTEIKKLGKLDKIGVILKIETLRGFRNLTDILLAGMQTYPIGVMIARGDLALEVGWDRIAVIQREIMKLCHAAHVPDIWATQVFETLAKTGVPSRSEMTDLWVAQRSECVMLNKGPYIIEAIHLMNDILSKMLPWHDKDSAMLPALNRAER